MRHTNLQSRPTNQQGFTAIELAVVLVIIGILVSLIFTTSAGIREKNRNTDRQTDITLIQQKLELYFAEYSKYPALSEINNPEWQIINFKGLNQSVIHDPSSKSTIFTPTAKAHAYAYIVTGSSGSTCNNTTVICAEYTLTATLEGGGTYTVASLN